MDKKKIDEIEKNVAEISTEMMEMMGVSGECRVDCEDEVVKVDIDTEEPGTLIGYRGEVLRSFQVILSLILYKKMDEWVKVVVDVAGYREERKGKIIEMAKRYADKAVEAGGEVEMPELTSYERRVVHTFFAESDQVKTESRGEGEERRLVIIPKE